MSGKVPLSKNTQKRRAGNLYRDFSGHEPDEVLEIAKPEIPDAVLIVGKLDSVIYTTMRDGVPEKYIHHFRRSSQPYLCSSPDGDALFIIGGNYEFTERGIVDK